MMLSACFLARTFVWFTRSHRSKGENRTRNRSEIARVNGPLDRASHYHAIKPRTDGQFFPDKFEFIFRVYDKPLITHVTSLHSIVIIIPNG
jgi:hypothetical protein